MALISGNGPIDYTSLTQAPDFAGSVAEGFQVGNGIREAMLQRQQQQAAIQQQAQYKTDLQDALQNPTAQSFATLTAKYPQQREAFKQSWDMLNQDQKDSQFKAGTGVFAALQNGQPNVATKLLDQHIQAAQNSGEDVTDLQNIRQQIETDPKTAQAHIGLVLSSTDGDRWKKVADELRTTQTAPFALQKAQGEAQTAQAQGANAATSQSLDNDSKRAGLDNLDSQISERASRLNLDKDRLTSEYQAKSAELAQKAGTLDPEARTLVNSSALASVAANQTAANQRDLASRLDAVDPTSGLLAKGAEAYKRISGNQDGITSLRNEYVRIRNSQAVKNLPPGSASDADVAMAMEGFPPETAGTKEIAQFLRGMAKLNDVVATGESAKAEWVNSVGSLSKPKTDINVGGVLVPAGTTYADFAKSYIPNKSVQAGAQQDQAQIPNRSYMKYATPGAQ